MSFTADELTPTPLARRRPAENAAYAHTMREFMSAVRAKSVSDEDRARILADRASPRGDIRDDPAPGEPPNHGFESREGLEPYFARVIANADDAPVEARHVPGAGFGLFATRSLKRFDVLWTEAPLVSTQTPENAAEVLACAWCHRSMATSTRSSASPRARVRRTKPQAADPRTRGKTTRQDKDDDEKEDAKLVADGTNPSRARGLVDGGVDRAGTCAALREAEGIAPAVPCRRPRRGCWAWYCSTTCRARHAKNGHDARCGARNPSAEQAAPPSEGASAEAVAAAAASVSTTLRPADNLALFAEAAGRRRGENREGRGLGDGDDAASRLLFRAVVGGVRGERRGGVDAETLRAAAARAVGLLRASAAAAVEPSTKKSPRWTRRRKPTPTPTPTLETRRGVARAARGAPGGARSSGRGRRWANPRGVRPQPVVHQD